MVKTTDKGKSWKTIPTEMPITTWDSEDPPHITQIVKSGGVIYASVDYQENGEKVRLYRVSADGRSFVPIQDMPVFDSGELKRKLPQNLFVEKLQESYSGATQFFKQLVQEDDRKQDKLIRRGLRGAFAVSGIHSIWNTTLSSSDGNPVILNGTTPNRKKPLNCLWT